MIVVGLVAIAARLIWPAVPSAVAVVAVLALLLGLVLPIRAVTRSVIRRRDARTLSAALGTGTPLDVSTAPTRKLVGAHDALLTEAARGAIAAPDAVELPHQALTEGATLLRGRAAEGVAEHEYVQARVTAITFLTPELARVRPVPAIADAPDAVTEDAVRTAAVEAIRDLESRTGGGSVERIDSLRAAAKRTEP